MLHLTFPPPSALAEADLRGLGISASSMASLHAFAQAAAKGTVELSRGTPLGRRNRPAVDAGRADPVKLPMS